MDEIPNKTDNGLNSVAATNTPLVSAPLGMTEKAFRTIREILLSGEYNIDELDIVEIVMEYERKTGAHIPDHWLFAKSN